MRPFTAAIIFSVCMTAGPALAQSPGDAGHGVTGQQARDRDNSDFDWNEFHGKELGDEFPTMVHERDFPSVDLLELQAKARQYRKQIRAIRYQHFGKRRSGLLRDQGMEELLEFTDPAAFQPMIEELSNEKDDVRLFMLEHFEGQEDMGQGALAWIALHDDDSALRNEARQRLTKPAQGPVRYVIETALKSEDPYLANMGGLLAGSLDLFDAVPLFIMGQATNPPVQGGEGDEAWIAIQQQKVYIAALIPIVGDSSGAFLPVLGVVSSGVILRVVESVVTIYRTEVHRVLVGMTSRDWGRSTEYLGYDEHAWRDWYNYEYLPFKREQAKYHALAEEEPPADAQDEAADQDEQADSSHDDDGVG